MISRENFDLVFLDRQIQAMDRQKVINAINSRAAGKTDIIVMTQAYHQKNMMQAMAGQKPAAFLLKPVTPFQSL